MKKILALILAFQTTGIPYLTPKYEAKAQVSPDEASELWAVATEVWPELGVVGDRVGNLADQAEYVVSTRLSMAASTISAWEIWNISRSGQRTEPTPVPIPIPQPGPVPPPTPTPTPPTPTPPIPGTGYDFWPSDIPMPGDVHPPSIDPPTIRVYVPSNSYSGPSAAQLGYLNHSDLYKNPKGMGEFSPATIRAAAEIQKEMAEKRTDAAKKSISKAAAKTKKTAKEILDDAKRETPTPIPADQDKVSAVEPLYDLVRDLAGSRNHALTDKAFRLLQEALQLEKVPEGKSLGEFWKKEITRFLIDEKTGLFRALKNYVTETPSNFDLNNPHHLDVLKYINHFHLARLQIEAAFSSEIMSKGFRESDPATRQTRYKELRETLDRIHYSLEAQTHILTQSLNNGTLKGDKIPVRADTVADIEKFESALKEGKKFSELAPQFLKHYENQIYKNLFPGASAKENGDDFRTAWERKRLFEQNDGQYNIFEANKYSKEALKDLYAKAHPVVFTNDLRTNGGSNLDKYLSKEIKEKIARGENLSSEDFRHSGFPEYLVCEKGNLYRVLGIRSGDEANRMANKGIEDPKTSTIKNGLSLILENLTPFPALTNHRSALVAGGPAPRWFALLHDVTDASGKLLPYDRIKAMVKLPEDKALYSVVNVRAGNRFELNIAAEDEADKGSVVQIFAPKPLEVDPIVTNSKHEVQE